MVDQQESRHSPLSPLQARRLPGLTVSGLLHNVELACECIYSFDPPLRKPNVKKTRVARWPGEPKNLLDARYSAEKHHYFTQIRLRKRTPQEAPVFLVETVQQSQAD